MKRWSYWCKVSSGQFVTEPRPNYSNISSSAAILPAQSLQIR